MHGTPYFAVGRALPAAAPERNGVHGTPYLAVGRALPAAAPSLQDRFITSRPTADHQPSREDIPQQ